MILVEFQNTIFNFSNANVIDIQENTIDVYYNNKNVVQLSNCETNIDTTNFEDYFFKVKMEHRTLYFNRYNFLYMQKTENDVIKFLFFEDFKFDLIVDYDELLNQLEND